MQTPTPPLPRSKPWLSARFPKTAEDVGEIDLNRVPVASEIGCESQH